MTRVRTTGGFTFIEVMIVVVIFGIMAALVLPSFSGPREKAALTSSARQIAAMGLLARQYAISFGKEVTVTFRPEKGEFQMLLPEPDNERLARRLREGEANSDEEQPRNLEQLVRFVEIMQDGEKLDEEELELVFHPNGSCNGLVIHLANKRGRSLTIDFERATARPEVYEGAPKSFAQKLRDRGIDPSHYGIEDDSVVADSKARRPGEGFSRTSGMSEDERVDYYSDVAERIMKRSQAQYYSNKEGGPAAYYQEASRWGR